MSSSKIFPILITWHYFSLKRSARRNLNSWLVIKDSFLKCRPNGWSADLHHTLQFTFMVMVKRCQQAITLSIIRTVLLRAQSSWSGWLITNVQTSSKRLTLPLQGTPTSRWAQRVHGLSSLVRPLTLFGRSSYVSLVWPLFQSNSHPFPLPLSAAVTKRSQPLQWEVIS